MKRIIFVLMLVIIACSLLSCGAESDTELYLVRQTVTENGRVTTVNYYYDENYMMVKNETLAGDISDTVCEISYDKNGYMNYMKGVSKSGLVTEMFLINDELGRVVEERLTSTYNGTVTENASTYEYIDDNGSYVRTTTLGATAGRVVTVTKDEFGNEKKSVDTLGQTAVCVNKYEGGLLVEVKTTVSNNSKMTVTVAKYEYDGYGNVTKVTRYNNVGDVIGTETYEYSSNVSFAN